MRWQARTAPCQPSTAGRAHVANSLFNLLANVKPVDVWLQWGPAPTTAYGWLAGKRDMAGQAACRIYPERGWGPWQEALRGLTNGEGPLRSRRCQNGTTRNTLSSGMLTTRFLFPKFFPKKFGQKIGAGPPTGNFGNGTCAGPVLLHPAPPFRADERYPRGSFPRGGFSRRGIRRAR
jgi:hypothetical protein